MLKRIFALLLCAATLLTCLSFVGCSEEEGEEDKGQYITTYLTDNVYDLDPAKAYTNEAVANVIDTAMLTAAELQQTAVEALKASTEDGKLSNDDIEWLNQQLLAQTKEKLSVNVYDLINAAGADIEALILGAGEAWVQRLKNKE